MGRLSLGRRALQRRWRNAEIDEVVTEVERFTGSRKFDNNVCVLAMVPV